MAQKIINVGTDANYGDGEPLRSAFIKVNENFTEVYAEILEGRDSNVVGSDSTILVDAENNKINLDGTVKGDIIPDTNVAYDIGSATKRFKDLYLSGNTINLGGTAISVESGELKLGGVKIPSQTDLDTSIADVTAGKFSFNITGDDSTVRTVQSGSNISIKGGANITTASDVDGNITITGPDLSSYLTAETSHADVVVDGDFTSSGFMKTDGAGNYSVDSSTYLSAITLGQVTGVDINNPQDNQVLSYNAGTGDWVNANPSGGALEGSSIANTGTNSFNLINFKTNGGNQVAATGFSMANNEIQFEYHNSDTGNGFNAAERASLVHFVNQLANGTDFTFVYVNNSSQTVTVNATVDSVTVNETYANSSRTVIQIFCTEDITPQLPSTTESLKNGETHTLSFSDTATLTLPVRTDNVLTANSIDTIQGKTIDGTKNTITGLTFAFDTIHEDPFFVTVYTATATTVAGSGTDLRSSRPITSDAKVNVYQVQKSSAEEKRCTLNFSSSDANTNKIQGKIVQVWNFIGGSYDLTVDYRNHSNSTYHQAVIPSGESAVFMFASTGWVLLGIGSDSYVDTHLNTGTASSGEVLSWTGSDYEWVAQSGGGGGEFATIGTGNLYSANLTNFANTYTSGTNNFFAGTSAGNSTTSGYNNVAIGESALQSNLTGHTNIAIGDLALSAATQRSENIGIGRYANGANTAGTQNIAIGTGALFSNTGDRNVAIGHSIQGTGAPGGGNNQVLVGYQAGYNSQGPTNYNTFVGSNSGFHNGNGMSNNTYVGYSAGYYFSGASETTIIGSEAGGNSLLSQATGSNNTVLGYQAAISAFNVSDEITLGNSSITTLRCNTQSITSLSDARDKKDVEDLSLGLNFVERLRPVAFTWNMRDGGKVDQPDTGFIAQELQQAQDDEGVVLPGLVYTTNPEKLEASYGKLIPSLVKSIQELSSQVKELQQQIKDIKGD